SCSNPKRRSASSPGSSSIISAFSLAAAFSIAYLDFVLFIASACRAGGYRPGIRDGSQDSASESASAETLNLMTTGNFSFERLLEIGRLLRKFVKVPLVANTRDINHREGEALLEAGFVGAYHAVRLAEGRDTPLKPEKRIQTIRILKDVGLHWMNCIEPVGPEHSHEEIVDLMFLARQYEATYSGIMRRINFPGSPMTRFGMISELEMARMVAVSRLVMGTVPSAHCTHEPHSASLLAGANLFFPEVGASPRDGKADTEKGRGHSVEHCHAIQREMEWKPELPSNCF
ncbi:MAG: hypothetical protein R6U27_17680, partial [Desulfobacterales bacterium]